MLRVCCSYLWSTSRIYFRSLFIIFVNDLDDGVVNKIAKFVDDTKIVSKVASEDQIKILRSDLHKVFNWSQDW